MDTRNGSFKPPDFQDKTFPPPGILPKNMSARMLSGVAVVMVVVIVFADMRSPKPVTSRAPAVEAMDPNAARIQEYQKRVEEQTRKLQLEQAALPDPSQGRGVSSKASSAPVAPPPLPPPKGTAPSSNVLAEQIPEPSRVQNDRDRRDEASLYASNIALTYRNQDAASGETNVAPGRKLQEHSEAPDAESGKRLPGKSLQQETRPSSEQKSEYRLLEGTVLETVLTNRLDGAFSGPVNCMVTTNVYSSDGQHLLIPQGSRVLGEVHKVDTFGQQRLTVAFHRLIMPNGYSLSLDQFQGLNQIGETGLRDQVNHYYLQVFGISLAIGAIAGLGEVHLNTKTADAGTAAYEQGVSSSLSESSLRILDRYLNVVPTFTIQEGHRVKVYLSGDLTLPIYDGDRTLQ